jgi:hypothetical protein
MFGVALACGEIAAPACSVELSSTKRTFCSTTLRCGSAKTSFSIRYLPPSSVLRSRNAGTQVRTVRPQSCNAASLPKRSLFHRSEQPKVAGANHVYARKINFIQDSVAQGKPNPAAAAEAQFRRRFSRLKSSAAECPGIRSRFGGITHYLGPDRLRDRRNDLLRDRNTIRKFQQTGVT